MKAGASGWSIVLIVDCLELSPDFLILSTNNFARDLDTDSDFLALESM